MEVEKKGHLMIDNWLFKVFMEIAWLVCVAGGSNTRVYGWWTRLEML